ncbi:MAG: DUF4230 domain-containing protein [Candidatus Promineofilum sp.]|nr:DUF4230 domain-containing protein [Promineifilum sp.]
MMSKEDMVETRPRSRAKVILLVLLVLFFVAMAFLAFSVARLVNSVNDGATSAIEPIGDRVRSLFVPATPVILPNPATVVKQINDLSRLETASYEMEKVVTADSEQDGFLDMLLGESMIFIAYGKVYAGVDFAEMQTADLVVVDPDTVLVHLPPAKIFEDIPVLDNERSFVADRDTGLLTRADPELETQVRQAAERSIREAAQSSDILTRANTNAQTYMHNFLAGLGFTEIVFTPDTPAPAAPYQQEVPKGYYLLPTATPIAP